jgi:hypothetical protein
VAITRERVDLAPLLAVFIALGVVSIRAAGRTGRLHKKAEKAAMNTRPDYDQKTLSRRA